MPGLSCYAVLHYLGHGFAGWQRQAAERTVQAELEGALERLTGRRVPTTAAGRTDTGVHALHQVVSFTMPDRWNPAAVCRAVNAVLPRDIWVARVDRAPPGFHARRHALARRYRYVVGCDRAAHSPFRRPFEWALGSSLDIGRLRAAAVGLMGEHDFRAFSAAGQPKVHYRCRVTVAAWEARRDAEGFIFDIEADRFLHRMVRFLVGTMVDIGRGRRPVTDITRLLGQTNNAEASPPAPPEGLYLVGVSYPRMGDNA